MAAITQFAKWQLALAIGHAVTAAIVFGVYAVHNKTAWIAPVHATYTMWSCTKNKTSCVPTEYRQALDSDVSIGILVMSFSVFSGMHHAVMCSTQYADHVFETGVNLARWADYAMSASLMLLVNHIMFYAAPSVVEVVTVPCIQFLVIVAGFGSEALWAVAPRESKRPHHHTILFACACLPLVLLFGVQFLSMATSLSTEFAHPSSAPVLAPAVTDPNNPPDIVFAFVAFVAVCFAAFAVVHGCKIRGRKSIERCKFYEAVYGLLSFFTKIPLACLFAGTMASRESEADKTGLYVFAIGVVVSAGFGAAMYWTYVRHIIIDNQKNL